MFRVFKYLSKYLAIFFAVFFVIDFLQIHIQLLLKDPQLDLQGVNNYFLFWQGHADSLALAFAVISLYFIFQQIELSMRQNYYPTFENWKNRHENALNELKQYKVIYHIVDDNLFEIYYEFVKKNRNLRIRNKRDQKRCFRSILNKRNIKEFESFMKEYRRAEGKVIDESKIESYANSVLMKFLKKTFPPTTDYKSYDKDLRAMYLKYMS